VTAISLDRPFKKHSYFIRQFQEIAFGRRLRAAAQAFRPDVVVLSNTPLASLQLVQSDCRRRNIPFVFWLMDLYSVAVHKILSKRMPVIGDVIGQGYRWLEKRQLVCSDKIILISEGFRQILDEWSIKPGKIEVMPLWAPLEEIPVREKDNPWSRRLRLVDTTNIIYSGTLGLKHNPAALSDLARKYKDRSDLRVIVISEGLGADFLEKVKAQDKLHNLVLLPFQPFEEMPNVLGAADIVITLLEPDAGAFSCPSKVLTYLCAGRAQVGAIPEVNRAARVIRESGGGVSVPPLDSQVFLDAVDRLVADPAERAGLGRMARLYAEREFDIRRLGEEFEGYLRAATDPTQVASSASLRSMNA
jgi:glycosyltransferase involved in cell wall biosynthesis